MWISEKLGLAEDGARLRRGRVTIEGENPAVDADGELRDAVLLAPAGISAIPKNGAETAVVEFDGETAVVGCVNGAEAKSVVLSAGGAVIRLGEDGIALEFGGGKVSLGAAGVSMSFGSAEVRLSAGAALMKFGAQEIMLPQELVS